MEKSWYSQREWDRVVGWGNVPTEYRKPESEDDEKSESEDEGISDKGSAE